MLARIVRIVSHDSKLIFTTNRFLDQNPVSRLYFPILGNLFRENFPKNKLFLFSIFLNEYTSDRDKRSFANEVGPKVCFWNGLPDSFEGMFSLDFQTYQALGSVHGGIFLANVFMEISGSYSSFSLSDCSPNDSL